MIYINELHNGEVILGCSVLFEDQLNEGWIEYDGEIPIGKKYNLIDGKLVVIEEVSKKYTTD